MRKSVELLWKTQTKNGNKIILTVFFGYYHGMLMRPREFHDNHAAVSKCLTDAWVKTWNFSSLNNLHYYSTELSDS